MAEDDCIVVASYDKPLAKSLPQLSRYKPREVKPEKGLKNRKGKGGSVKKRS